MLDKAPLRVRNIIKEDLSSLGFKGETLMSELVL